MQLSNSRSNGLFKRLGMRLALPVAQNPHPVLLFSQVHQLKIVGKRPREQFRFFHAQPVNDLFQPGINFWTDIHASRFGQRPHPFFQLEQLHARLMTDHLPQNITQQMNVFA